MFEQSVVEARALTSRPWTLAVSLCGQAVLITAAIVLPLLHPDTLKRVTMLVPIGGPPTAYKRPEPQKIEPGRRMMPTRSDHVFRFTEPASVPRNVAMVQDALPEFSGSVGGGSAAGVVGGLDGIPGIGGAGPAPHFDPPPPSRPANPPAPPVAKPAAPPAPVQIRRGGEVQASLLTFRPEPVYPPLAKQARISGVVRMSAIIATDGRISSLRVLSGHPLLVNAAVDAVKRWIYSPTLLNGVPVEVITDITVTFTLN
jgi:periplasmic protein TonB